VDIAADDANRGNPLSDWEYTKLNSRTPADIVSEKEWDKKSCFERVPHFQQLRDFHKRYDIERCMAFLEAHHKARSIVREEFFTNDIELSSSESQVLRESRAECEKAVELLDSYPSHFVERVASHRFCIILLNNAGTRLEHWVEAGIVKEQEAEELLEDIQEQLNESDKCSLATHPGQRPLEGEFLGSRDLGAMVLDLQDKTELFAPSDAHQGGDSNTGPGSQDDEEEGELTREVRAVARHWRRQSIADMRM